MVDTYLGYTCIGLGFFALSLSYLTGNYEIKSARDVALPTINGESVYATITCSGSAIAESHLFSEKDPVLLGRIAVFELVFEYHRYYPQSGYSDLICERNKENIGPVGGIYLNYAEWQGAESSTEQTHKSTINKEWFKNENISIFGNVEKKQNGYEISGKGLFFLPFVVTLNPEAMIANSAQWDTAIKMLSFCCISLGCVMLCLETDPTMPLGSIKRLCSCLHSNSQETYSLIKNAHHNKSYSGKQDAKLELALRV